MIMTTFHGRHNQTFACLCVE